MSKSEDDVGSPEREACDVVALQVDGEVVEAAQRRQRVDLLHTVDVGRTEHHTLNQQHQHLR